MRTSTNKGTGKACAEQQLTPIQAGSSVTRSVVQGTRSHPRIWDRHVNAPRARVSRTGLMMRGCCHRITHPTPPPQAARQSRVQPVAVVSEVVRGPSQQGSNCCVPEQQSRGMVGTNREQCSWYPQHLLPAIHVKELTSCMCRSNAAFSSVG
jgi:hypothetical protein